jgi:hypothetical protein
MGPAVRRQKREVPQSVQRFLAVPVSVRQLGHVHVLGWGLAGRSVVCRSMVVVLMATTLGSRCVDPVT